MPRGVPTCFRRRRQAGCSKESGPVLASGRVGWASLGMNPASHLRGLQGAARQTKVGCGITALALRS